MHSPPNKYIPEVLNNEQYTSPLRVVLSSWFCGCLIALFFFPQLKAYIHTADDNDIIQTEIVNIDPSPPEHLITNTSVESTNTTRPPSLKTESIQEELLPKTRPQRILLVGSSSMNADLGAFLAQHLRKEKLYVHRHAKVGSGLARPDFYDWMSVLPTLLKTHTPDLVIVQFIGNDCQSLIRTDGSLEAKYGEPEWSAAYEKRIMALISMLHTQKIRVAFLGMSNVLPARYRSNVRRSNAILYEVANRQNAPFVSLWEMTSTPSGMPQTELNTHEIPQRMFREDGIHLSRSGARMVARDVYTQLNQFYDWKHHR